MISMPTWAFDVPKGFKKVNTFGSSENLWIDAKSLETVQAFISDLKGLQTSKKPIQDLKEISKAKSDTLSQILNIKGWKITGEQEVKYSDSEKTVYLFGQYMDSEEKRVFFVEIYNWSIDRSPTAYLITNYKKPYTAPDLNNRFKFAK